MAKRKFLHNTVTVKLQTYDAETNYTAKNRCSIMLYQVFKGPVVVLCIVEAMFRSHEKSVERKNGAGGAGV